MTEKTETPTPAGFPWGLVMQILQTILALIVYLSKRETSAAGIAELELITQGVERAEEEAAAGIRSRAYHLGDKHRLVYADSGEPAEEIKDIELEETPEDPYREERIGWLEYRKDKCEHCAKALELVQRGKLIEAGREMQNSDEIDCLRLTDRILWGWVFDLDE